MNQRHSGLTWVRKAFQLTEQSIKDHMRSEKYHGQPSHWLPNRRRNHLRWSLHGVFLGADPCVHKNVVFLLLNCLEASQWVKSYAVFCQKRLVTVYVATRTPATHCQEYKYVDDVIDIHDTYSHKYSVILTVELTCTTWAQLQSRLPDMHACPLTGFGPTAYAQNSAHFVVSSDFNASTDLA